MRQINSISAAAIIVYSQQTLSLEECYALSIKYPIARQTDLLQQNQSWKLKH
jgi:hypothetical protein